MALRTKWNISGRVVFFSKNKKKDDKNGQSSCCKPCVVGIYKQVHSPSGCWFLTHTESTRSKDTVYRPWIF